MTQLSNEQLKQREHDNWSAAAEGWRRRDALLRKGAAPVTDRMLELCNISSGSRLLDIASGTGEPSISAAKIVGHSGKVIGTDLSEAMLVVAKEKAAASQLNNIEYFCLDAESLSYDPASFDAVSIRWGLMFMPEPVRCLIAARNALKEGGRISLACWTGIENNPFVSVLMKPLGQYMEIPKPPSGTPGIFAMADKQYLHSSVKLAGFKHIEIEEMQIDVIDVTDGLAYWEAMSDLAAPVMALVKQLDEASRLKYIDDVIELAETYRQGDSIPMKGTTWIVSAENSTAVD